STEQDSSATPQSVVTAKCLPTISPRVRKIVEPSSTVHATATPRNRASRLLVFDSPEEVGNIEDGKEGEATNSQQQLSSAKLFQGDDVAVKAKELAGIVKNNSKFREALKGGLQGKTGEEVRDRLKKLVASKDALQSVKQKLSAERLSASKVVYKSPIKIAPSQKPSTSAIGTSSSKTVVVPDFVLPLQKPKTPSKFGTPNKLLRTPVKDVYDNDDDSEEALRSPLKHGRAALLVSEVKNCAALPLPVKYERLYKLFGHMERVVSILYRQDRRITFDEVSRNVQKNIKCDFTRHHFAQIMSVYPKAFHVRLEEHWAPIGGTRGHDTRYDYVIEPNFKDDIIGFMREDEQLKAAEASIAQPEQPRFPLSPFKSPRGIRWGLSPLKKTPTKIVQPSSTTSDAVDKKPKMEVWRTTVRSYIFKYHLQQLVRTQHKSFLDKIGVKLKDEEMNSLRRYHPDFKLDEVDDIPEAELPEPPKGDEAELKTMRDYMRTVEDSSGSLPKRIQEMIDELRSPEKRAALVAGAKLEIPSSSSQNVSTEQKPKKMSLLERIRAKEQAKKCAQMMLDPEKEIRKDRYYAFKKASTMEVSEMVSKLLFSANNCARR
ncbi:unnamed protein product, partial [Anisakis simplex]|uniref:CDT1 domain-containing protein n=1 Tax=Anisakis simplex TaxID=6269 RepID=A0A0M3J0F8_ANISI